TTRNWTSYNFQVLRDDVYTLGVDGTVTGNRVAPARSACAVLVSSQNADRGWLYYQQQTISAEGFSGQSFSTFVPHTVRGKETKTCSDCHVSRAGDNNAWMAQLLMQGTNFMNFIGRYVFVAEGKKGYEVVTVAEHDEPPAVIGSDFQKIAYPENYKKHIEEQSELEDADHKEGSEVLDLQARGEYLYAALGKNGLRVYDIANIDNKDISEKMTTAPFSPLGLRFYVPTKYAMAIATPTTLGVDPLRSQLKENEEQSVNLLYGFLYVADKYEGLVIVGDPNLKGKSPGVGTLLDGNPANNFLKRAATFNPEGALNGARRITIAGTYAYILCDRSLVVVNLDNPLAPKITATIAAPVLNDPRVIAIQFRYAFVVDREGLKVLDVTNLSHPKPIARDTNSAVFNSDVGAQRCCARSDSDSVIPTGATGLFPSRGSSAHGRAVEGPRQDRTSSHVDEIKIRRSSDADSYSLIPLTDARNIYIARTYAYISAGAQGIAIIDVENPEKPKLDQLFSADGKLNDVNDVKIGMVAASAFAFVAEGKNGLRILQIISPWDDPAHFSGFSPR